MKFSDESWRSKCVGHKHEIRREDRTIFNLLYRIADELRRRSCCFSILGQRCDGVDELETAFKLFTAKVVSEPALLASVCLIVLFLSFSRLNEFQRYFPPFGVPSKVS